MKRLVHDHDGIYDVLVEECHAPEGQRHREAFEQSFPECREYRFMGSLGFGGKVWWSNGRLYVTCYPEDDTPEREAAIDRANDRLLRFVKEIR